MGRYPQYSCGCVPIQRFPGAGLDFRRPDFTLRRFRSMQEADAQAGKRTVGLVATAAGLYPVSLPPPGPVAPRLPPAAGQWSAAGRANFRRLAIDLAEALVFLIGTTLPVPGRGPENILR